MVSSIPMKTTMDRGGRVMVPAQLRLAMGLKPGQRFKVRHIGDRIELEPEDAPVRLEIADDGLPLLVDDGSLEPTTLEETVEEIRAAREERLDRLDPHEGRDHGRQ